MRVTVCQMQDAPDAFASDWAALCRHVAQEQSALVLLPEMPFAAWFGIERAFAQAQWDAAVNAHERWVARLDELAPAVVLSTAPVERGGRRLNEAFVWAHGEATPAHHKRYLPEEDGFWEASWYERGDGAFELVEAAGARVGFQICTELWTLEEARKYGLAGADIVAAPRATPMSTGERWLVAGRAAAILAGAYCLSSNHCGASVEGGFEFAGLGWIIDPDGEVLAQTSDAAPFVTCEIDLERARAAKSTYPRYVR
jgi:N-carbamoylputrescine amidase